eukprot:s3941_g3.t1
MSVYDDGAVQIPVPWLCRFGSQNRCGNRPLRIFTVFGISNCWKECAINAMRYLLFSTCAFGLGVLVGNIFSSNINRSHRSSKPFLADSASQTRSPTVVPNPVTEAVSPLIELVSPAMPASQSSETTGETQECQELRRPTQLRMDGDFLKRDGQEVIMELPKVVKCDPLEHLLVINLEGPGGQARRDHIYKEFERGGLKGRFKFWPAVNFQDNERLAKETGKKQCPCDPKVGCALSHREIYEMMLYEKWPCATIFEDDVGLATNFSERVAAVADSLPPFDVVLWGFCPGGAKPRHESPDKTSIPKVKYGWPGSCVHAYTVSLQGAYVLTAANTPVITPPDGAMDGMHHWRMEVRTHIDRSAGKFTGSYWYVDPMLAFQPVDSDNLGGGV